MFCTIFSAITQHTIFYMRKLIVFSTTCLQNIPKCDMERAICLLDDLLIFLLDLNNNCLKYRSALSLQPTALATLVLFSMNTLPSRIKSLHFLSLATITSVNFTVSAHTLTSRQPAIATSIVYSKLYCNSLYHNLPNCQLNRLQQIQNFLAGVVVKAPKSTHITPILKSRHWLKVSERIEYKLLSLSLTKFLQLLNLAIFTTLSLFNLLAVPAPHLCHSFLPANHLLENHRSAICDFQDGWLI